MKIKFDRWPWQEGGGQMFGRFGGGWRYKFGVDVGGSTIIFNLIWGIVRIDLRSRSKREEDERRLKAFAETYRSRPADF